MKKEERVLKTINREEIDYLPSQITFSDRTRLSKIVTANMDLIFSFTSNPLLFSIFSL